ncbi:unnamed protein product [Peronospora belbahrii]|uniref:Coiled-coil domain-containing protein 130 n=1 Tax=Peronospora belbahrii TaxID=622444 RepID=A0AAU9LJU7_9STRA|nr:unnamed protein product [Peronospora belbahrii]
MSSLAAAQADGYYYPSEWRPEYGSLNQFQQSHPLGKRAKHLVSDGVLVVRFEMPFHVWCSHCNVHIGRGVRFNARKKKVGQYFSSVVWEFCMKKQRQGDAEELQTERLNEPGLAAKLQSDPFIRLEHENEDERAAKKRSRGLEALVQLQDAEFKDDFASNSALREQFRRKKKQLKTREQEAKRLGIGIPLLDVHPDDVLVARTVVFKGLPQKRCAPSHRRSGTEKLRFRKPAPAAIVDSFQHFGDFAGSHLQRLKMVRQAAKRRPAR